MKPIIFTDKRQTVILEQFKKLGYDLPVILMKKGCGLKGAASRKASEKVSRILRHVEKRLSNPQFLKKIDKTDAFILAHYLMGFTNSEIINWLNSKSNALPNRFKNLKKSGYFKRLNKMIGTLTAKPKLPIKDPIKKAIFEDNLAVAKFNLRDKKIDELQLNVYIESAKQLNRSEFIKFFSDILMNLEKHKTKDLEAA